MSARTTAAAVLLLVGQGSMGCAIELTPAYPDAPNEPAEADTASTFALASSGGAVLMARVDGADILGSEVRLARFDEGRGGAIRGHAAGRLVNVEAGEGRVTGLVSGGPIDLTVARTDDTLVVSGLVRGRISSFRIDSMAARGTLGGCSYELARDGLDYEGRRSCGGPTERVSLRIPTELDRWGDDERAAVLAILLDRG